MSHKRPPPTAKRPHSRLAMATGALGVAATAGGALPVVRGLAGRWIQLLVPAAERSPEFSVPDPRFSALYLVPFLIVLGCSLLAIVLGMIAHLKCVLDRHTSVVPAELRRSPFATVGVVGGSVGLWFLLLK